MSDLQIYAGLAPIALGLVALVFAQLQLQKIRLRKSAHAAENGSIVTASTFFAGRGMPFRGRLKWKPRYKLALALVVILVGSASMYVALDIDRYRRASAGSYAVTFKEVIGADVLDAQNKKIGEVSDFLVHDKGGTPTVVVHDRSIKGNKSVELPFTDLQWHRAEGGSDDDDTFTAKVKNQQVQKQILQAFSPTPAIGPASRN